MGNKRLNTELQRGLLRAHAEQAQRRGAWLRFRAQPQFVITPAQFFELLHQGRFETTSPVDWEIFEEPHAEEAAAVTETVTTQEKDSMDTSTTAPAKTPRRNNAYTAGRKINYGKAKEGATGDPLEAGLRQLKALEAEKTNAKTTYEATLARIESQRQALVAGIMKNLGTGTGAAVNGTGEAPPARRVHRRRRATGIRAAVLELLVKQGPQTKAELATALKGQYSAAKIERNIWPMLSERILFRNEQRQLALGPNWTKTKTARAQVLDRKVPFITKES